MPRRGATRGGRGDLENGALAVIWADGDIEQTKRNCAQEFYLGYCLKDRTCNGMEP